MATNTLFHNTLIASAAAMQKSILAIQAARDAGDDEALSKAIDGAIASTSNKPSVNITAERVEISWRGDPGKDERAKHVCKYAVVDGKLVEKQPVKGDRRLFLYGGDGVWRASKAWLEANVPGAWDEAVKLAKSIAA